MEEIVIPLDESSMVGNCVHIVWQPLKTIKLFKLVTCCQIVIEDICLTKHLVCRPLGVFLFLPDGDQIFLLSLLICSKALEYLSCHILYLRVVLIHKLDVFATSRS